MKILKADVTVVDHGVSGGTCQADLMWHTAARQPRHPLTGYVVKYRDGTWAGVL
jgi:hypothetical protein